GYWFIFAESLEEALEIASGNPCLECGLFYEIRPMDPERATASAVTTETPRDARTDGDSTDLGRLERTRRCGRSRGSVRDQTPRPRSGPSVKSSRAWPTPRSATRPTETKPARSPSPAAATKSDDASTPRSTERHIDAIRLTSFTAGPTTVKSRRSSLPTLP